MKKHFIHTILITMFIVISSLFVIITAFLQWNVALFELVILAVATIYTLVKLKLIRSDMYTYIRKIESIFGPQTQSVIDMFPLPMVVVSKLNEVILYNELFRSNILNGEDAISADYLKILPEVNPEVVINNQNFSASIKGRLYTVYGTLSRVGFEKVYILYFIDDTDIKLKSIEYDESRPCVALILFDNYEELMENSRESEKSQILGDLQQLLEEYINRTTGFFRRLDKDRYICIFEERHVKVFIKEKFDILDIVRKINSSTGASATVSIGIGRGGNALEENEAFAREALEMALGRGGDQVAIKTNDGYEFFGGVSKGIEKRNKVKTRMIAAALKKLVTSLDNVLIMGHRFADHDVIGAAAGLYYAVEFLGKDVNIVVDSEKNLSAELISGLSQDSMKFIDSKKALTLVNEKTLLIIVDTHIPKFIEFPEVYEACENVVVIDHHRKMVGHIDKAFIFYHDPYASSTSEMVTELIQYLDEGVRIKRNIAEALMAGIMLDTKNFCIKTGTQTFEAAAYLRRMGADTIQVRRMSSSSMDTYQHRSQIVTNTEIYKKCAIAVTDLQTNDLRIVAPQAADELMGISGVDASFVIYKVGSGVSICARSLGDINVQLIMESIGGGGHLTMSGAQIETITLENARHLLIEKIDDYFNV